MRNVVRKLRSHFSRERYPSNSPRSLRKKPSECLSEALEPRVLLTVDFNFNFEDVIGGGAAIGFEDASEGQARRDALQAAAETFGSYFNHDVTIDVDLFSTNDAGNGSLIDVESEFGGAPVNGFANLTVAHNKILTGVDLNGGDADITLEVNWGHDWDLDDEIASGVYDFKGVVMRKFSHALGWTSTVTETGTSLLGGILGGVLGEVGNFTAYDQFLSDDEGNSVIDPISLTLDTGWLDLSVGGSSANGDGLFFNGTSATAANGGVAVGLESSATWDDETSVITLDSSNSEFDGMMMQAEINTGELTRTFSAVERGVFRDLGYNVNQGGTSAAQHVIGRSQSSGNWWLAESNSTSFTSRQVETWSASLGFRDIMTGDYNGDGLSDIAGRTDGDWWVGISDGTKFNTTVWTDWDERQQWQNVMTLDFNNDGMDDLIGRSEGNWWISISNGTGFDDSVAAIGKWSKTATWEDVMIADVNGDSLDDIVGRANGNWWAAISDGTKLTNDRFGSWSNSVEWFDVGVGDFNNDGMMDVAGRANGNWWVGLSNGNAFTNTLWAKWSTTQTWEDVIFGDFSGDGRTDIAGRNNNGLWNVNVSNGLTFNTSVWGSWASGANWNDVQIIDVNNDGWTDIVGRSVSNVSNWWVAVSDGSSFTTSKFETWSNPAAGWGNVFSANPIS